MKKIKNISLLLILTLCCTAFCLIAALNNNKTFAEGSTVLDESTATVKVTFGDNITYYESFSDAIANMQNNSTITLLKDTSLCATTNKAYTVDLNGKTLAGGAMLNYCTVTILDGAGSGKITGNLSFYASKVKVSAGEIETIVVTNGSNGVISGGKINRINAISKNLEVSGGEINNLCIYDVNNIHLSGGTINYFNFVSIANNFAMLNEGYIYSSKADNTPIKIADMTSSTQATVIKCPHPSLTNCICDYCGYVCDHIHFDSNGVCDICDYVCPHEELNDNHMCLKCNLQMQANVKNSSTSKNYLKIEDAILSIKNDDVLTLYSNITLNESLSIDAACTIDLCGYSFDGYYIYLDNNITVIDSKGNGFAAISTRSASAQIQLKGADTTIFLIMLNKDRLKFYSGRISSINIYNGTIDNVLPEGYIFVKHDNSGSKKLTKQETNTSTFSTENDYLTCEACLHDSVDDNLNCKYCAATLSQEQILKALLNELQSTKYELSQAIAKKEDIEIVNKKVKVLNETINNVEAICKTYSDDANEQLKTELQNAIESAKLEAISSSSAALDMAKNELQDAIDKKLDIDTYNSKMNALTAAINNAVISCNAYTNSQDSELKEELETKINAAKISVENAIDLLSNQLDNVESKADNNAKEIIVLKIISYTSCGILLALIIGITTFAMIKYKNVIFKKKK